MANRGPDDYVSATAAAHRLGVSTRTLRRYTPRDGCPMPEVPAGGGYSGSATWMPSPVNLPPAQRLDMPGCCRGGNTLTVTLTDK